MMVEQAMVVQKAGEQRTTTAGYRTPATIRRSLALSLFVYDPRSTTHGSLLRFFTPSLLHLFILHLLPRSLVFLTTNH